MQLVRGTDKVITAWLSRRFGTLVLEGKPCSNPAFLFLALMDLMLPTLVFTITRHLILCIFWGDYADFNNKDLSHPRRRVISNILLAVLPIALALLYLAFGDDAHLRSPFHAQHSTFAWFVGESVAWVNWLHSYANAVWVLWNVLRWWVWRIEVGAQDTVAGRTVRRRYHPIRTY